MENFSKKINIKLKVVQQLKLGLVKLGNQLYYLCVDVIIVSINLKKGYTKIVVILVLTYFSTLKELNKLGSKKKQISKFLQLITVFKT